MRSSLIAAGLLAAASTVSAKENGCGQRSIQELIASNACGDNTQIAECLNTVDIFKLAEVIPCFVDHGCSEKEASFFAAACLSPRPDLKRNDAFPTGDGSFMNAQVIRRADSTTAAAATTAAATTGATSLVCSTTYTTSVEKCVTTTDTSSHIGSTCSQAAVTTSSCAPGMICFVDSSDESKRVCMIRDDKLSTGGLIVSLFFSVALVGTIGSLFAMSRIEKSKAKKDARERAALLGGDKSAMQDVEQAKPYRIGGGGESNDDADISTAPTAPQIKLHQGIDGLGQAGHGGDQHWSNEYNAGQGNRL